MTKLTAVVALKLSTWLLVIRSQFDQSFATPIELPYRVASLLRSREAELAIQEVVVYSKYTEVPMFAETRDVIAF